MMGIAHFSGDTHTSFILSHIPALISSASNLWVYEHKIHHVCPF